MCILKEIFVSVITAFLTSKIIVKREKSVALNNSRKDIYEEMLNLLVPLKDNPCLIFEYKKFIEPLNFIEIKINYIASKEVVEVFDYLYKKIREIFNEYVGLFSPEEEYRICARFEYEGISKEKWNYELEQIIVQYQQEHIIPEEELKTDIDKLTNLCRHETGNKKIRRQKNENKTD